MTFATTLSTLKKRRTRRTYRDLLNLISPTPWLVHSCEDEHRLHELWLLDCEEYGEMALSFEEFSSWWRQYPYGSWVLTINNVIKASIGIYPIPERLAEQFIDGELQESLLTPVSLSECQKNPQQYWYVSGIFRRPGTCALKQNPLVPLIMLSTSYWIRSGRIKFPTTLLAIGETNQGISSLKKFGFTEHTPRNQMIDGYPLFSLTLQNRDQATRHLSDLGF